MVSNNEHEQLESKEPKGFLPKTKLEYAAIFGGTALLPWVYFNHVDKDYNPAGSITAAAIVTGSFYVISEIHSKLKAKN